MADVIRVLLIEDNPGDARLIRELLTDVRGTVFHIEWVDRLSSVVTRLDPGTLDVALVDLSLPDSRGFDTFQRVREAMPGSAVIVLSGLADEGLALRAVREGAQDYLVKGQITPESLSRCIRYAVERQKMISAVQASAAPKKGKVVCFWGAKGGVGTTTVALSTAAVLAQQHRNVLAIEMRPDYGSFSAHLRTAPSRNLARVLEAASITPREVQLSVNVLRFGLKVLYGPQKVGEFQPIEADRAEMVIEAALQLADTVIIDLDGRPSAANETVLRHADYAAVVVERETVALQAGRMAVELLRSWGVPASGVGAVVINRMPLAASSLAPAEIREMLECELAGVVPPAAEICVRAHKEGVPLAIYQPDCPAATSIRDMAGRLAAPKVTTMAL